MADRRKGLTISIEFLLQRLTEVLSMVVNIFLALLFTKKEILIAQASGQEGALRCLDKNKLSRLTGLLYQLRRDNSSSRV